MGVYKADKIIETPIVEVDLCCYFIGDDYDLEGKNFYRLDDFVNMVCDVIPEFSLGINEYKSHEIRKVLKEASKAIYKINDFEKVKKIYMEGGEIVDGDIEKQVFKRGEFGELILHLLLREFHQTVPLISKIYFKDSQNVPAHGFDSVHITDDSIWLGESKLYNDGKKGVKELVKDVKEHFKNDYLNQEFVIISNRIKDMNKDSEREKWLDILDSNTALKEQIESITIPLLCTYESENFSQRSNFEQEIRSLKSYFDKEIKEHPLHSKLRIILLLFPVQSKKDLIKNLHIKLSLFQNL